MTKLSGADNPLHWRYRRDHDVLYITAQFEPRDAKFVLVSPVAEGSSRAVRVSTLVALYKHLQMLEARLGAEGWELLPVSQRAPNRLRTPVCTTCGFHVAVEVTRRTPTDVHFRCSGCGEAWVVPKPGPEASKQRRPETGNIDGQTIW